MWIHSVSSPEGLDGTLQGKRQVFGGQDSAFVLRTSGQATTTHMQVAYHCKAKMYSIYKRLQTKMGENAPNLGERLVRGVAFDPCMAPVKTDKL